MRKSKIFYAFLSILMIASMLLPNVTAALGIPPNLAQEEAVSVGTSQSEAASSFSDFVAAAESEWGLVPEAGPLLTEPLHLPDDSEPLRLAGTSTAPTPSEAQVAPALSAVGTILFAPAIDLDNDPATNPVTSKPAPVVELLGEKGGIVELAIQLQAFGGAETAVNVPITFRVWDSQDHTHFVHTLETDTWATARVRVPLEDIGEIYSYQASAPGFGQTEIRRFRFNTELVSYRLHMDGADLSYEEEADRWFVFTLESPLPLNAETDVAELRIMRRPSLASLTEIQNELSNYFDQDDITEMINSAGLVAMPTVLLEVNGDHTAQARVQLPPGDYAFIGMVEVNGTTTEYFHSEPDRMIVEDKPAVVPETVLHASEAQYELDKSLIIRENEVGRVSFDLVETALLPAIMEGAPPVETRELVNLVQTGPFEWREERYDVEIETIVDDGKKSLELVDFSYDPLGRRYTIAVESLQDTVITDTMRIDVYGPGGVVIMHEDRSVVLQPGEILYHDIEVPAHLGEPEGLRVGLDDPILEDIQTFISAIRTIANTADFQVTKLFIKVTALLLGQKLIEVKYDFVSGQTEFKTPFWDDITRRPFRTLIQMAESVGQDITLFKIRWGSLAWDVLTGKFFGRNNQELEQLLDKILAGLSVKLGGLDLTGGADVSVSLTADPTTHCPDPEDIDKVKQNLQDLARLLDTQAAQDAINFSSRAPKKIKLIGWLALSVGSFRAIAGTGIDYEADFTLKLEGEAELGVAANIILNPFNMFELLKDVYELVRGASSAEDFFKKNTKNLKVLGWFFVAKKMLGVATTIKRWNFYYNLIKNVIDQITIYGDCDPDPPDPRPPDDRQDVWQGVENFYEGESHAETIDNLSQLIQRAQLLGLSRAEILLTLRLREAELVRFLDDNEGYVDYLAGTFGAYARSDLDVLDIISGTVQLTSTVAISQAILARLDQADAELANLPYVVEQEQRQNNLTLAEQQFQTLQGQELELQEELRQLFTTDTVGVLASGFAEATQSSLAAMGLPSLLVSPWPGSGLFRGQPAGYVAPGLAPRVVVAPSGSLHAIAKSAEARDWLEAYVEGGGLLIAFTQAFGDDWSALPGGEVNGVGYEEDRRWQHGTVEAAQPSDWLVFMGIPKPDVQIDGAFTSWPANSKVLLKRTFGDYRGFPVLLEYAYGSGTVLATSAYGDWAWQTNFWWGDDARFTHSILIRGYLLANGQDVGDVFAGDPATSVNVSFPLTNTAALTATEVKLTIPLVWGRGSRTSTASVPLNLAPGDGTQVSATIPTPPVRRGVHDWTQVGLYRTKMTVKTSDGNSYSVWGPFVYVRSPIIPPALSGSLQVEQSPVSLFGTAVLTASVQNFTGVARTATISDTSDLPTSTVTLNVPANGTATHVYTLTMDGSKTPGLVFYDENNKVIGRSGLSIQVAYPDLKATPLIPAAVADGVTIPVVVTNQARQGEALAASLALTLTAPSGATVWTSAQALPNLAAGETITPTFTLALPGVELGTYQLTYRVDDGRNLARTNNVPIPSQLVLDAGLDRSSYRIRETGTLTVIVQNAGRFDLPPVITVNAPDLALTDAQTLNLPVNDSQTLVYPFAVPDTLVADTYDVVVGYQVGSTFVTRTLQLQIPQSRVFATMGQTSYAAGDAAVVELSNTGGVDAPVTGTVRLVDVYGTAVATDTFNTTVLAGQFTTVTLAIPAGAIGGDYYIELFGQNNDTGAPVNMERYLSISGTTGTLSVYTGQDDYFSDEQIDTFADILVSSGGVTNGDINLRICSANPDDGSTPGPPPKINYDAQTVPINWIDIASGGTPVARGTNTYQLIDIGFPFQFYGVTYTQMYVGSNGYITFGSGNTSNFNQPIPDPNTPNNAIYALWDYLYPLGGIYGSIYVEQIDATRTVIQWDAVTHCCGSSNPETFQVILDGSDHSILLQYEDVSFTSSATVGLENSFGSDGLQIAYNQSGVIVDGLAIKLSTTQVQVQETTYNSTAVPLNWIDIASGGTIVSQGTNRSTLVDIGFPFQFYGITYTQMYVNSNGYVTFGNSYNTNSNQPIPTTNSPNNAIYALWDYLYPLGGIYGNIYVEQIDATRTVIQWDGVTHCCGSSNPETFQIILDGSDHSFTLQYEDVSLTDSATVGVENASGTNAIQVAYNEPNVIVDGLALEFEAASLSVPDTTYSTTNPAFNWIDVASGGNVVAQGDNTSTYVNLGFPFDFYGVTYTDMYVNSNGYVTFGNSSSSAFNTSLPDGSFPNNAVYAFWDDLYPVGGSSGSVYAEQVGPERYVVQWQDVAHCCGTSDPETFQIIVDGSDDSITLQYLDVSDPAGATVGVENSSGTDALQISYNQSGIITDNLAIKLTTGFRQIALTDYITATAAFNWRDIAGTGTIVSQGDDTYEQVAIGFPFQFYGITYTNMYVDSNGYLTFSSPNFSEYSNSSIPSPWEPNNAIYGLWTDLYPTGGIHGNVYSEQISPTMHIVQWDAVNHCCSTGITETFQIVLDGTDNTITLQYLDLTEEEFAVVGVENIDGSLATVVYDGGGGGGIPAAAARGPVGITSSPVITNGTAVALIPQPGQIITVPTYISTTTPISWTHIGPVAGTNIVQGNNTFSVVDIGFPFQFYGITYTQMYVGDNGFISFENGYTNSSNGYIPSGNTPNNAIYGLWDYLYPIGGNYGQIFTRQVSPTLHVIQWEGVAHCCSTGSPETFQIILDGSDNSITLQYEDVSYTSSATIGIEDRSGSRAERLSYFQTGVVVDGSAFKLTPSTTYVQQPGYLMSTQPISWTSVAPISGTQVLANNNTYQQVDLGFPFQFYGITYTQMFVGDNGFLSFENGYTDSSNGSIPSLNTPNNAIYALWDYLYPIGGNYGMVYARQVSPTLYVVQWENVAHCCNTSNPETFQVVIDGSDNSITLQYEDVSYTSSATVGVENRFGSAATQLSYNQSGIINDGTAFRLTPATQLVTKTSYLSATLPISWTDVAPQAGTQIVAVGRNTYEQVNIGFPFDFYGQTYNDLYVGSNGYVTFGSGNTSSSNTSIPNFNAPNNAIYALWDYLNPIGGSSGLIYTRQVDSNRFVIQWEGVEHCCSTGNPETFQIILDRSNDTILLQYEDVSLTSSATVGVETEFGGDATQIAYNQSGIITDGTAYELTPIEEQQPPPPICDPTQPLPLDVMLVIDRSGSMSGSKIVDARNAAVAFVDFMDLTLDQGGLVSFSSSATLNMPLTQDENALKAAINSLFASGGTRIDLGLNAARAELVSNGDPNATPVIILLSDGVSSGDPIGAANAAKALGIRIITIGLGSGADAATLRAIATTPDDYYFAPASSDLQLIFESIGNAICRSPLPYDASCGGYVLWETTLPVATASSLNLSEIAGPLDVSGRMTLDGRLFADTNQPLARDQYPFYLHNRSTALTLETDRYFYRPGDAIQAGGLVTNTSSLTVTTDLELWANTSKLLDQPITLAPGGSYAYSYTLTNTANLSTTNLTFVAIANDVSVFRLVVVTPPTLAGDLRAPDVVRRDPFSATLVLSNTSPVTVALQPTINGQAQAGIVLDPTNVFAVDATAQTLQDIVLTGTVSGDVTQVFTKSVTQGELATVTLLPPSGNLAGPIEIPYQINGTGLLFADGEITLEVNGQPLGTQPFGVPAGKSVNGRIAVTLPPGTHTLTGRLTDQYGPFDTDTLDVTLLAAAEPAVADISDVSISVPPTAAAGGSVDVTVNVTNDGAASPIIIGLQLFEPEKQWIVTPTAHAISTYTFTLGIPADMPADEYFGEATVDGTSLPFIVQISGIDIEMGLALDKTIYNPGDLATLTVTFTETAGISGDYLFMPRYLTAEDYVTITIPANQTVTTTFTFTATEPARINVFLATTASPPDYERRVLMLDSLPVPVRQPERGATFTFDKLVYDPGDTVYMTVTVTGTVNNLVVMGPMERVMDNPDVLIWGGPVDPDELPYILTGTYTLSTTLPSVMKEGRYTFLAGINNEIFTYPIDVRGYKVTTRHIEMDKPRYDRQDELTAVAEFWNENDTPINGLQMQAWIVTPDNSGVISLSPQVSRTIDLQPGLNVITVTGQFSTSLVGAHRLLVNLNVPGETWRLAGAAAQFNVGWASLIELNTDKGIYAVGEPATGRLDVYGYGPTQLTVTLANDGSTLFSRQADLSGFHTFTFTVPTPAIDSYLLIADSIDQTGNTDQLTKPYAVPAPADGQPPQITLDAAFTNTVLTSSAPTTTFTFTGSVSDNAGSTVVIVNGEVISPTPAGDFTASVEVFQGFNTIAVTVVDDSGNVTTIPFIVVEVVPGRAVSLAVSSSSVKVGDPIEFQVRLTSTNALSQVNAVQILPAALVTNVAVLTPTYGTLTVTHSPAAPDYAVSWTGDLTAPVTFTVTAVAAAPGLLTQTVDIYWSAFLIEPSNQVSVTITTGQPPIVDINADLGLIRLDTSLNPEPIQPYAPAGVYTLDTTFQNIGTVPLQDIYYEVIILTNGNVLMNADGGPGGVGATISVPAANLGPDGILDPGETFDMLFDVGLAQLGPFDFYVYAYGRQVLPNGTSANGLTDAADAATIEGEETRDNSSGFWLTPNMGAGRTGSSGRGPVWPDR